MILLLVHLSDIHITAADNAVLGRATRISEAVRNVNYNIDLCVVVVSGDIAYSGTEDQYQAAWEFLDALKHQLTTDLRGREGLRVELVIIPGNHDCNHELGGQARELVLNALSASADPTAVDASTAAVCTAVQRHFFTLREGTASAGLTVTDPLYWEYTFDVGQDRVLFRCCNTAWVSRKKEQAGSLVFPVDRLRDAAISPDLTVTVFHHPYNWLTPNNARAFRKRVEVVSDVLLSGHEHDATVHVQRGVGGESNIYVEGGALQDNYAPDASAFNALLFDTGVRQQQVVRFAWDGTRYIGAPPDPAWEPYQVSSLRTADAFEVSAPHQAALDDLGIAILHPIRGQLARSDVFVSPDLRQVTYAPGEIGQSVRGGGLLDVAGRVERVLVTGADKAGKTSLAKQLFVDARAQGFVPVIVSGGGTRLTSADRAVREVERAFSQQYQNGELEAFRQLERGRRVLIVDEFDRMEIGRGQLDAVLAQWEHFAGRVFLLANDIAQQVNEIVGERPITEGRKPFTHYRLQPFGHQRRNELAERWFALDADLAADPESFSRRLVNAKQMMDTAIGRNFVPAFPVFLLPILQAEQHNERVNTGPSTYGYFYELLIRRSLAEGSTKETLDVKLGYLTHLAFALLTSGTTEISERVLRELHAEYESRYMLDISFVRIVEALIRCQVLDVRSDAVGGAVYAFKYPYIYYYFVASYLRDQMDTPTVQATVAGMAARLHQEDAANILLFLAHLSRHPFIIEQMLRSAEAVFANGARAELRPEESPLLAVDASLAKLTYQERAPHEARRELLAEYDAYNERPVASVKADPLGVIEALNPVSSTGELPERANGHQDGAEPTREQIDKVFANTQRYLTELGAAFKTMQILGQIVKNFPGSVEGALKMRLTDACYGIGLRTLRSLFGIVEAYAGQFSESVIDSLRADEPLLSNGELASRARESLFGMTYLVSLGMIRRISNAVGAADLVQVYAALRDQSDTPAAALIHTSLLLDQLTAFPEAQVDRVNAELGNNPVAHRVLRALVLGHFYLFDARFDLKQRVCAKLDVPYRPLVLSNPRTKLIASGRPRA